MSKTTPQIITWPNTWQSMDIWSEILLVVKDVVFSKASLLGPYEYSFPLVTPHFSWEENADWILEKPDQVAESDSVAVGTK